MVSVLIVAAKGGAQPAKHVLSVSGSLGSEAEVGRRPEGGLKDWRKGGKGEGPKGGSVAMVKTEGKG